MDVIPLDASLVRGSHGRIPDDPSKGPLLMTRQTDLLPDGERGGHRRARPDPAAPRRARPRGGGAMTLVGRKADHLRIAAGADVAHTGGTGLERFRLRHRALPERDLARVSLETSLLGARLGAPIVISAMTGGTPEAEDDQRAAGAGGGRARAGDGARLGPRAARRPCGAAHLPQRRPPAAAARQPRRRPGAAAGRARARRAAGLAARGRRPDRAPEPDPGGRAAGGRAGLRRRRGRDRRGRRAAGAAAGGGQGGRLRDGRRRRGAAARRRRGGDRRGRRGRHQLGARRGPPRRARRRRRRPPSPTGASRPPTR